MTICDKQHGPDITQASAQCTHNLQVLPQQAITGWILGVKQCT